MNAKNIVHNNIIYYVPTFRYLLVICVQCTFQIPTDAQRVVFHGVIV